MIAVIGNRSGITNKVLGTFNLVAIPVVITVQQKNARIAGISTKV